MGIQSAFDWVVLVSSAVSLILNGLLLVLITFAPRGDIGSFRHFLVSGCVLGILYSLIFGLLAPMWLVGENFILYFSAGAVSHEAWAKPFLIIFICTFLQNLLVVTSSFAYRYLNMARPFLLKRLHDTMWIMIMIAGNVLLIFIWTFIFVKYCWSSPGLYSQASALFEKVFSSPLHRDHVYIGVYNDGTTASITYAAIFLISNLLIMVAIILFSIKCILSAFRTTQMSAKSRKQHRQLFALLILQFANPAVFIFFPTGLIISFGIGYTEIGKFARAISALYGFFPVINPIIIIFFVSSYRKLILQCLNCVSIRTKRNSPVDMSSSRQGSRMYG